MKEIYTYLLTPQNVCCNTTR